MLVLSRRAGQAIHIGRDIVIHIIRSTNHQVRVGIDAPKDVIIRRHDGDESSSQPPAAAGGRA